MTVPRCVVPLTTYLMTRRCTQREHLLRPDAYVEQVFQYCLGEAAKRFGITLHAWVAMSNHEHIVLRDNHGNLPDFMGHLNKMLAKALNAHWKRRQHFWDSDPPSVVRLVQANDRFEKLVYLLANPVASDLVEHVSDWPGACSLALNLSGKCRTIKRPRGFFRDEGPMPESVTLRAEKLDGFEMMSDDEWSELVGDAVKRAEDRARALRKEKNVRVLGRKAVLETPHTTRATTSERQAGLKPHVACKNPERRAIELAALLAFREAHRIAMRRWLDGEHIVAFPAGTYRMRAFVKYAALDARRLAAQRALSA